MNSYKEEAIIRNIADPTSLLLSRLENWALAVRNLENYVEAYIALQKANTSGLEKTRKIAGEMSQISTPSHLSPVNHNLSRPQSSKSNEPASGPEETIFSCLEGLSSRTEVLITKSSETELALKQNVLPLFQALRTDIDKNIKDLKSANVKQAKEVEKARSMTLQSIETLGTYASSFTISGDSNRREYRNDPYVLYRLTLQALDDQLAKENAHSDSLIVAEKNLQNLETHLVQVLQQATKLFSEVIAGFHSLSNETYFGIAYSFANISPEAEWSSFYNDNINQLVPYDRPLREISNVTFQNDNHPSTKPVVEGTLNRKEGKILKSWTPGYYVLTQSHFLLQYESNNYVQDPSPELAIYLPESTVSGIESKDSGKFKFTIHAKDQTRTVGLTTKTYSFKANTLSETEVWHRAISNSVCKHSPPIGLSEGDQPQPLSNSSTFSNNPT